MVSSVTHLYPSPQADFFWIAVSSYRLGTRPWLIALNLVLFDQLLSVAHRHQWGVRLWHEVYRPLPEQAAALGIPPPPPVEPLQEATTPARE